MLGVWIYLLCVVDVGYVLLGWLMLFDYLFVVYECEEVW